MTQKPTYEELERKVREFQETSIEWERAKKLLRKSGELYRNVYDTAPLAFVVWDLDTRVTDWNRKAEKVFGWSKKEALGQPFFDFLIPQKDLPYVKTIVDKLVKDKLPSYSVNDNLTKSGRVITCEWNNSPLHDDERNIVGVISLALDITERNRAEEALRESEESFRMLSEGTYEAIVIHEDGKILHANQQYYEMFGYTPEELNKIDAIPLTVLPESLRIIKNHIVTDNRGPYVVDGRKKDGTVFPIEIRVQLMGRDGRTVRMVTFRDLSRYKQVEDGLRKAREELEGHVKDRTVALKQEIVERKRAEEKLEKHQHKLRSLASQLSLAEEKERRRVATEVHDYIGQNLAFVKIKLNGLRKSVSPESSQSLGAIIELVDKTIDDTRHLVTELGSPVLYELGLVPALASLAGRFREDLAFNVIFEDDKKPKQVSSDVKVFVFQAARELLSNVAKHANAANCTMSLKAVEGKLRLDIVDDGLGFDKEKLETVHAEARGFGFFSIRERLEPLGGSLEIYSEPNEGTRITLFAPLNR